jgi:protein-S-isoprenylcysteine O-methyltransferase Ste14
LLKVLSWKKVQGRKKEMKKISVVSFVLMALCLIVGASFHPLRMQDPSREAYALGTLMGTVMISLAGAFFLLGILFLILCHRKKK